MESVDLLDANLLTNLNQERWRGVLTGVWCVLVFGWRESPGVFATVSQCLDAATPQYVMDTSIGVIATFVMTCLTLDHHDHDVNVDNDDDHPKNQIQHISNQNLLLLWNFGKCS